MHRNLLLFVIFVILSTQFTYSAPVADWVADPVSAAGTNASRLDIKLPLDSGSVRFAVIGDSGTGEKEQYKVAEEMESYRQQVKFDFVIMLGDNIYGSHRPKDFEQKFEQPYKPILDAGVKFYASLGNHDDPNDERLYKPFDMGGQRYYNFSKGNVEFFVLDSNYVDPNQLSWLQKALQDSKSKWKICYFHHPLYSDGKVHGPDLDLRTRLVPLFRQYGVNAVFSGHEHAYERIKPREGIAYFILGNSGKLVSHDFSASEEMEKGYDNDRCFMMVEVSGDKLYYQTVTRKGETIDSGVIERQQASAATAK
jgi:predicted MPP superfamily phosphohydrolase